MNCNPQAGAAWGRGGGGERISIVLAVSGIFVHTVPPKLLSLDSIVTTEARIGQLRQTT